MLILHSQLLCILCIALVGLLKAWLGAGRGNDGFSGQGHFDKVVSSRGVETHTSTKCSASRCPAEMLKASRGWIWGLVVICCDEISFTRLSYIDVVLEDVC